MANIIAKIWLLPSVFFSFCTLQSLASTPLPPLVSGNCPRIKDDPNNLDELVITCALESSQDLQHDSVYCSKEEQALIVLGDYGEFYMKCSAVFPIRFNFDGITPTEAIHEYSSIRTEEGLKKYNIHVRIQSIGTVRRDFSRQNPREALPSGLNYSRTGRYTFDARDSQLSYVEKRAFYIFFEEPEAKPEFIRNEHVSVRFPSTNDLAFVPCRPTHYNSYVELKPSSYLLTSSKISGLKARSGAPSYTCTLKYGKSQEITDQLTLDTSTQTGKEDIVQVSKSNMLKFYDSNATEDYGDDTIVSCTNHDGSGRPLSLAVQHTSTQFDYKRLYKFVFPKYRSRSHLVITKDGNSSDKPNMISTNLTRGTTGIIFCGNDKYYDVTGFSVDFKGKVNEFHYEDLENYLKFSEERIVEDPGPALRIFSEYNENSELFADDNVSFSCQFDAFYLCAPPTWVQEYQNGTSSTLEKEYVSVRHGFSNATVKLHLGLTQVSCKSFICGSHDNHVSVSTTVNVKPRPTLPPLTSTPSTLSPSTASPSSVSLYTRAPVDNTSTASVDETPCANSTEPSVKEYKGPSNGSGSVAVFVVVPTILLLIIGAAVYWYVRRKNTSAMHLLASWQIEPWRQRWQSFRRSLSSFGR